MRPILILAVLLLTGCAGPEWAQYNNRYGYRPEDPCIRCGEKWDVPNNHPFEAQIRRARGEQW
jgi:hypothetical protein